MYSTQEIDQNENKEIKSRSHYQNSVSSDTIKSNRSRAKCVSEMKGKKNKVRHQNNHLAASAICNDYLSKKLNSVDGLPKVNSDQCTFSDKDGTDVFFFDLSGNKISCSPDSKTKSKNNGSVLSLSPQDVVTLRKNKQKHEKKNTSMQKYSNEGNYSNNYGNRDIKEESSNQRSVETNHCKIEAKTSKSKENNLKKAFEFEKSFETLLEYYNTAQSTPIQSENEDHSRSINKKIPKMIDLDDLEGDENCDKKKKKRGVEKEIKKKHKRRRSNSGDRIHLFTSSSDENKEGEKESDISLKLKKKKRKSGHQLQQSVLDISGEHNVNFSGSRLISNFKKLKKIKDSEEHSSFNVSSENLEIDKDTGKNHNKKYHKSKSFDNTKFKNESRTISDVFELDSSYFHMSSDNIKIRDGVQRSNDDSLKSNEFKRKKHKRKHSELKGINHEESKYKSDDASVEEGFSENIDEKRIESPDKTKTIYTKKYYRSKLIGDTAFKTKLEIDSSESELNITHKKRKHKEINTVSYISSIPQEPEEQKLECPDNATKSVKKHGITGSTDYEEFKSECKIECSESELELSDLFTEKKRKYVSSIENNEKSICVLEENSQSKSKRKKKRKVDSSLDDETSLNQSIEKKKKTKKSDYILDNGQQSIKNFLIPAIVYEHSFENHRLMNEMKTTSPVLESNMKRIQNFEEEPRLSKKSNSSMEQNIEEPINTVQEPDWNMGSPNMKEELDISDNDLKKFNNFESSESDSSEKRRCRNIRKINKHILLNMDSKHDGAEVLKNLNISIPFTIPPLHIHLKRASKPSLDEINAYKNFNIKLGAYSQEEDQIIKNNWERFCKEHNLNIEPSAFFSFPQKMKVEEKLKFLQYISHGLDNRLPHRVHYRFKTLFGNMIKKTGRFTEEEDNQILEFMEMESSKTPFTDLAKILNRPSNSIERHYKRLHDQEKLVWTPSKADQLINCMLKVTKLEKPEQLKDWKFTSKQWKKISKKMEGVPIIKLQRAWNITIYPRLFSSGSLALAKKLIIDMLDERQETDWRLIDWKEISKKFPGFSSEKLYMMFKKLVIFNVPKHLQKDVQKCIECLKDKRIATPHKFRKYEYKNGHLVYEDSSEVEDNVNI